MPTNWALGTDPQSTEPIAGKGGLVPLSYKGVEYNVTSGDSTRVVQGRGPPEQFIRDVYGSF